MPFHLQRLYGIEWDGISRYYLAWKDGEILKYDRIFSTAHKLTGVHFELICSMYVEIYVVLTSLSSSLAKQPLFWAVAFLRRFCHIASGFQLFGFRNSNFFYTARSSALRPTPQPGGPGLCIYVPQWQGGPVIPPGTRFPFRRLLRHAGIGWRYSNPPLHGNALTSVCEIYE
jgi:hypothetical protein